MSDDSQTSQGPQFHILKQGQEIGPLTEDEVRAGLESGRFSMKDMVREEAGRTWARLRTVVEPPPAPAPEPKADWPALARGAWARLCADFTEQPLRLGFVAIGSGLVLLLLTRWPFVFWLPAFGLAALLGTLQVMKGRHLRGAPLLIIPVVISLYAIMRSGEETQTSSPEIAEAPAVIPEKKSSPVPAIAAVPESAMVAKVEDQPDQPPQTPAPVALVAEAAKAMPPVVTASVVPPNPTPAPSAATPAAVAAPVVPALAKDAAPVAPAPPAPAGAFTRIANWFASLFDPVPPPTPRPARRVAAAPTPKAEFINKHRNAFVILKSSDRSGSGFVCRVGDTPWVFTNAHVVAGAQGWNLHRLDGALLTPGISQSAGARDVVRMSLRTEQPAALEAVTDFDREVTIGDEIEVIGNSGGGGVISTMAGEVVGIGPDRLEISAPFIAGNSGSPILHSKTGRVIGIATYLTVRSERFVGTSGDDETTTVRRFGFRIDNVPQWEAVTWPAFQAEAERMRRIEMLTADIYNYFRGRTLGGLQTEVLRRAAAEWMSALQKSRSSPADRAAANTRFLAELRGMVRTDVVAADAQLRYGYFREQLRLERQIRDRLYEEFDKDIKLRTSTAGRLQ